MTRRYATLVRRALRAIALTAMSCALLVHAFATPQTPAAPPAPQPGNDTFFAGVEKFEKGATSVTRVESDHDHDRDDRDQDHDEAQTQSTPRPHRLSAVYVFSYDRPGLYNPADVDVFRRKAHTPEWTCRDCAGRLKPGESLDACTRSVGPSSVESVVIDMRPQKLAFVHTIGKHSSDPHQPLECHEDERPGSRFP